ncbi:MAG: hypothetical protein HYY67_06285 [Thaumarchaeota archaeon]|nr:hypothetical protein [Nitrososphaerota archaeon]
MSGYKTLAEIFGWLGAIITIIAYALISFGVFDATNILYQILNLTGAVGVGVVSIMKKIYQPATLEVIWALIAFIALLNIIL